jgi:hypothetical protein
MHALHVATLLRYRSCLKFAAVGMRVRKNRTKIRGIDITPLLLCIELRSGVVSQ